MADDFKSFRTVWFENIKARGMYEWEMKPIELIVNVTFSVVLSPLSFVEKSDFRERLKNQFSLVAIDKSAKILKTDGWKYDGSRYTYGHDYTQIRLEKRVSSLGIDLYFIQTDEAEDIENFYQTIIQEIAEFEVFKSSKYFVIRPHRKNEKLSNKNQCQEHSLAECS